MPRSTTPGTPIPPRPSSSRRGASCSSAFDGDDPVACGAVRVIGPGIAEIKRMYVAPRARGRGLGRTLLGALERGAVELGCRTARLDTMAAMAEAGALYRSAGYEPIADYNGNPLATDWMERALPGS